MRPSPRLVSVVVPVRNGAGTIAEQFAALAAQTYRGEWEVVVADNGSTDGTRAVVDTWAGRLPGLRTIDASGPAGPGVTRNCGAREAAGDFLVFCDADDVVEPGWIAAMVAQAPRFDVVTGPLDSGGVNAEVVEASRPPRAAGLARSGGFLPFAPSGNLGVWADVFSRTGGFDAGYRQCEDIEWSWRAQLATFTIGFAPEAVVHYRYRVGSGAVFRQAFGRGLSSARLYRDYRNRGMTPASLGRAVRVWGWLAARIGSLVLPSRRATWIRRAGEATGRFAGSLRYRVLFL